MKGPMATPRRHTLFWTFAACVVALLASGGCQRSGSVTPASSPQGSLTTSDRGPGLRRQALETLQLPGPRTLDLTYVNPASFAAALGNDPGRIFEFVRDSIAFESYAGVLRGPRGTLLALAGNSADRAALLGAMLEAAGQRVRYARGLLGEKDARDLTASMWAERQAPPLTPDQDAAAELRAIAQGFLGAVRRDFDLIRRHLQAVGNTPQPSAALSFDSLAAEARDHFWVQWARGNAWVDLDPSFNDSTPGRAHTRAKEILGELPDSVFHQVRIRVRVEEYAEGPPSSREILTYTARASDLSGRTVLLSHVPENWRGPAGSVSGAIAAAIEDTGRVKPILLIGEQVVSGEPFYQRPPGGGIGSIGSLLGGEGTRKPIPLAAAEFLEVEFVSPGGRAESVVREIFDLVGPARRAAGQPLSPEELRSRAESADAADVSKTLFSLFLTTGRIDTAHILTVEARAAAPPSAEELDVGAFLHELNLAFVASSDMLAGRTGRPDRAVVLFYQDSPRLTIADLSQSGNSIRLTLDLRRDYARAVAMGPEPETIVLARVQRGVIDGTLERVLLELALPANPAGDDDLRVAVSTSALFELAATGGVPTVALSHDQHKLDPNVPADAQARVREDTSRGHIVVAPERSLTVRDTPRFAWWRIHPVSGETTAVTDEGLHAVTTEYTAVTGKSEDGTQKINIYYNGTFKRVLVTSYNQSQIQQLGGLPRVLSMLRREGFQILNRGLI